jgi:hypothetical protein
MKHNIYQNMGVKVVKNEQSGTPKKDFLVENTVQNIGKWLELIKLINETPNDMDLGREVRRFMLRMEEERGKFVYPSIH